MFIVYIDNDVSCSESDTEQQIGTQYDITFEYKKW